MYNVTLRCVHVTILQYVLRVMSVGVSATWIIQNTKGTSCDMSSMARPALS